MKKINLKLMAFTAAAIMIGNACSKIDSPKNGSISDPTIRQHNEDVNNTKKESDNLNTEINDLLKDLRGFGKTDVPNAVSICGATIDTSQQYSSTPTVIITFDGTTACGNPARIRGGEVKVELVQGNKWADQGSVLKVTHTNYKVTFVNLNNHYVTYNGVKYLTNVSGIDYLNYVFTGALTAKIKERTNNMTVTFEDGSVDSWNWARMSTLSISGYSNISITVNGDTTINGKTVDSWGKTRLGADFITEMISPWVSGSTCGWLRPTQGKYTSSTNDFYITATCGVDKNGNTLSPNSSCGSYYGYKVEWNYKNGTAQGDAVIQYF